MQQQKLMKSPNNLNLNQYTHNSQGRQSFYEQSSSKTYSAQWEYENFANQIYQLDQVLKILQNDVNEAASNNKSITDFYPEFVFNCKYDDDQQKKTIHGSNFQMIKVLSSLQKSNSSLKDELKGWCFQFAKKARFTQTLISQNQVLRKYVGKKNKQIIKLIQAINSIQNSDLKTLQQNLGTLKEQNGILKQHLNRIKQKLKEKSSYEKNLLKGLSEANKKKALMSIQANSNQDTQQHLAKSLIILNENEKQYVQRENHLTRQRQRLINLRQEYLRDRQQLQKELSSCQMDRKDVDQFLKIKFNLQQDQKQKLNVEIEQNTQQLMDWQKKIKQKQQQIEKNETKLSQYVKEGQNLEKKLTQANILLSSRQKQLAQIIDTEVALLSSIDILNIEINQKKQLLKNKPIQEQQQLQAYRTKTREFQAFKKQQIQRWNYKLEINRKNAFVRIQEEKNTIQVQKLQIQELLNQISQTNKQIKSLVSQYRKQKKEKQNPNAPSQKIFYPI